MGRIDIEPTWQDIAARGTGLEVYPVGLYETDDGRAFVERAHSPADIQFWGVYVHRAGEGATWIADYDTRREAEQAAERILDRFENLHAYGLMIEP